MKMMDKAWVPARGPGLPWVAGEYESLRDQVRRFVEEEIKPHGEVLRLVETDSMQLLSTFFPRRGHAQSLLANHLVLAPIPVS
jgi:hypothetical protein